MKPVLKLLAAAVAGTALTWGGSASAAPVTLDQAIAMSLKTDPRIQEQEQVVEAARALLDEVRSNAGLHVSMNAFEGLSPAVSGPFNAANGQPRTDGGSVHGISDWTDLQFSVIAPLYTFGKIKHYAEAAQGNIDVKRQDVRLQREQTAFDVRRAWYGYLTARDTRALLEDLQSKVNDAQTRISQMLDAGSPQVKQSDLFAIQAAQGLLAKYLEDAKSVESIALNGLKVLTGVGLGGELEVADDHVTPVPLPTLSLADEQARALADRPEMAQLEAGLRASRALVEAKRAEGKPNIYAGVIGTYSYSSRRDRLNNPYITDPFNTYGATPVIGVQWNFVQGTTPARVAQAQADLNALIDKNEFAQHGIPFQVAEDYANMTAAWHSQQDLREGARAARRWMISEFADFNAGLGKSSDLADAMKTYALASTEYLKAVNDYDVDVAEMQQLTGSDD